ncbi:MAG: sulfite exporter TauE/SafE family protein [Ignavibacteriaceae bacterium]|jgi:sulfite exporter TauE/SafE
MEIFAGLVIGFIGSFHCIGMCGPIALALPIPGSDNFRFYAGRVIYNFGRIFSYALMGIFIGFISEKLVISGFQQILSISLGILILIIVLIPRRIRNKVYAADIVQKLFNPLKVSIGSLFKQKSYFSFLSIGFLNGFLPCGFVYAGLAGAISTGSTFNGMLFMIFFGLGTFPAMFTISIFSKFIKLSLREKLHRLVPVFAIFLAVLFIMRGMNLGIPYVSPKIGNKPASHHMMNN